MHRTRVLTPLALALGLAGCASSSNSPTGRPVAQENVRITSPNGTGTLSAVASETPDVQTLPSPVEQVWRALPAVYDTLGIEVATVDASTHTIGNPSLKIRRRLGRVPLSRIIDCGSTQGTPSADSYEVVLSVHTRAQPAAASSGSSVASTIVSTTVDAQARPVSFAGEFVRCSTTGTLEQRLLVALRLQLLRQESR